MSKNEITKEITLENLIATAIQIPGVKVDREMFLREQFKNLEDVSVDTIVEVGPVNAGVSKEDLLKKAETILRSRTTKSALASFAAGIPGGLAMAATIPADMLQFYGVALGMAQEIAYLYGEEDLWEDGQLSTQRVIDQLILYCGVMLGASGASQTVRVMSSALAKQAMKKLPQKALTQTFYYPIVKSIAQAFGAKMTKEVFAKGVSKAVPIIGGVVSGGITLATMLPMGGRLIKTLEEAHFSYTEEDFQKDWKDITEECEKDEAIVVDYVEVSEDEPEETGTSQTSDALEKIKKAKEMLDMGIITEEEFSQIKAKLISEL